VKKPKAVLFDMGETLIRYDNFNPLKGTEKILGYADNPEGITAEQIQDFATELNREFNEIKDENNIEISCRSFQRLIFEMHGVKINKSPIETETMFKDHAWDLNLIEGVIDLLDYLEKEGIRIAILSNTTFSEELLRQDLRFFEIEDRFEFVISTAEYCLRKPDERIFYLALNKFGLDAEQVWYVGNSYRYDVAGAHNANIFPVWYNVDSSEPELDIPCYEIQNYSELIEKLKALD